MLKVFSCFYWRGKGDATFFERNTASHTQCFETEDSAKCFRKLFRGNFRYQLKSKSYLIVSSIKRRLEAVLVLYIHKEWRLKEFSQIGVSVYCGVPEGSLLGPLLFNVFIKDLNFSIQLSSLRLYADETTAYASNANISALKLSLNQDPENLSSLFASNYFSVRQWQENPSIDPSISTLMNLLFILATLLSK